MNKRLMRYHDTGASNDCIVCKPCFNSKYNVHVRVQLIFTVSCGVFLPF